VAPPRRLAAKLGHPLPGEDGFGSAVIESFEYPGAGSPRADYRLALLVREFLSRISV
jgi:hypothetical protein